MYIGQASKKSETVLDLGCGAGLDLLLAAQNVDQEGKVIGIDMNEDMLKKQKRTLIFLSLKISN